MGNEELINESKLTIFLGGGGSAKESYDLDSRFVNLIANFDKPLLYIPLARDPPYEGCLEWIKDTFRGHGYSNIEMVTDLKEFKIKDTLSNYSAVYMGGGNASKLLYRIKESGFGDMLVNWKGGLIYGGSAGAMVLGRDISATDSEIDPRCNDLKGCSLIGDFTIGCHWNENFDEYYKLRPIILIPERAGVIVKGGKALMVGQGIGLISEGCKKTFDTGDKFAII